NRQQPGRNRRWFLRIRELGDAQTLRRLESRANVAGSYWPNHRSHVDGRGGAFRLLPGTGDGVDGPGPVASQGQIRQFSVLDALIMVAGIAAGIGLAQMCNLEISIYRLLDFLRLSGSRSSGKDIVRWTLQLTILFLTPFLAGMTSACLLLQFRRP